MNISLRKLCA